MGVLSAGACGAAARAAAALPACLLLACGPNLGGGSRVLPGQSTRLQPIYDFAITYPDLVLVIGGLSYTGLQIDLEIEFDDASLRDGDPAWSARGRVQSLFAGGVAQAFEAPSPLEIDGALSSGDLTTGLFGPIRVGTATLFLELRGTVGDAARHVAGSAALFGSNEPGSFLAVKRRRYLVAGTDLQAVGKAAVVTVRYDTRFSIEEDLELISSDPVARVEDRRPLILNRLSYDNLQGLDPADGFRTVFQTSAGNGSNPHDVVVLPSPAAGADGDEGLAFVTRYEPPYNDVAVIDLKQNAVVDRIDLAPYARNPDHLPRPDQALLHDGLLYVTLQDADRSFSLFMNGRVAVIDPASRAVLDVIDLQGQNPFEALAASPETGLIYVGLAGIFPGLQPRALTGGIEVLDPVTRRPRLLVDDDDLGGNVTAVALAAPERGYCVVSDASFRNFVKAFDPATGQILGTVLESANFLAALESDGDGYLLVGENEFFSPRILVFDASSGQPVAVIPTRLPPFSFATLTRSLP